MHHIENHDTNALSKLLQKIQNQHNMSQDFIAPTDQLVFQTGEDSTGKQHSEIVLEANKGEPTRILGVNDVAFDQVARDADIAVRTARRLRGQYPEQWDSVINAIWQKEPKKRMVRAFCLDDRAGTARAFVSDKFKTFDNFHLAQSVIPELMESGAKWQIEQAALTDRKMYMRFRSHAITGEGAGVGDLMALGLGISNSEVSEGSIQVYQINWTLACLNGMQTQNRTRKNHVTTSRGDADTWSILSDEAKDADNAALSLKMRDIVREYASRESFDRVLEQMRAAADDVIEGDYVQGATDKLAQILTIPKKETGLVLQGLIDTLGQSGYEKDKPISRATLVNAVTACAHKADDDSVDDWQKLGGDVLNLSAADWSAVSRASVAA